MKDNIFVREIEALHRDRRLIPFYLLSTLLVISFGIFIIGFEDSVTQYTSVENVHYEMSESIKRINECFEYEVMLPKSYTLSRVHDIYVGVKNSCDFNITNLVIEIVMDKEKAMFVPNEYVFISTPIIGAIEGLSNNQTANNDLLILIERININGIFETYVPVIAGISNKRYKPQNEGYEIVLEIRIENDIIYQTRQIISKTVESVYQKYMKRDILFEMNVNDALSSTEFSNEDSNIGLSIMAIVITAVFVCFFCFLYLVTRNE